MIGERKQGMPTWLKVVIGVVVAGIIGIVGFVIFTCMLVANVTKGVLDPVQARKVEMSVVKINQLPPEFKRTMAFDMLGTSSLAYSDEHDGLSICMVKLNGADYKGKTAQEIVDTYEHNSALKNRAPSGAQKTGAMQVVSRGETQVAGESMPYALGNLATANGDHLTQIIGCILPKSTNKPIVLIGQTHAVTYNMEETKKFLNSIEGF